MRRYLIANILAVVLPLSLHAQASPAERLFIATDRECYVAGDDVFCSAFCFDESGALSTYSRVAYMELISTQGTVKTAKLALNGGRGGGVFTIPTNLPTGNYRLVAYTAQNKLEEGYDYIGGSHVISIFNTLIGDRVPGGVKVVDQQAYGELAPRQLPSDGRLGISLSASVAPFSTVPVVVNNKTGKRVSLCVSIFHDDGMHAVDPQSLAAHVFAPVGKVREGEGDYEGEVVTAQVVGSGFNAAMAGELVAFIAAPSGKNDTYATTIAPDGKVVFHTNNIYGENVNLVAEIDGLDPGTDCHLEVDQPFVQPKVGDVPQLMLSSSLYEKLVGRGVSMQERKKAACDTLFDYLPKRPDPLFDDADAKMYPLDDYVRFPTMRELFVEILPQVRGRQTKRRGTRISVLMDDRRGDGASIWGNSLTMVDGVPVLEHSRMWDYDPYLIDTVQVFQKCYNFGNVDYEGVINFSTFKKSLPGITFDDSVRIIDWSGVSLPVAFTQPLPGVPDHRRTIWWHPLAQVEAGGALSISCCTPDYKGTFRVVVQGVTEDGERLYDTASFTVR